ncbi:MAG: hypothetical protein ACRDN0_06255 [Trebonia sp.]
MGWAGATYLHSVPTAGNDVLLIALLTAVGAVFGLFGGLLTRVRFSAGAVRVKATAGAAALWVISMGARMAFAVWSTWARSSPPGTTSAMPSPGNRGISSAHDLGRRPNQIGCS